MNYKKCVSDYNALVEVRSWSHKLVAKCLFANKIYQVYLLLSLELVMCTIFVLSFPMRLFTYCCLVRMGKIPTIVRLHLLYILKGRSIRIFRSLPIPNSSAEPMQMKSSMTSHL